MKVQATKTRVQKRWHNNYIFSLHFQFLEVKLKLTLFITTYGSQLKGEIFHYKRTQTINCKVKTKTIKS